jgi:hypothetical protein
MENPKGHPSDPGAHFGRDGSYRHSSSGWPFPSSVEFSTDSNDDAPNLSLIDVDPKTIIIKIIIGISSNV